MSGIGKTTLGRAVYERISHQYDFRCYIDDVSKIYRDSSTLGVQKQLLCQSLDEKNLEICNVSEGTSLVWTRLCNARALIVLDNVDQVGQLKMFTGSRDTLLRECLGGGSKIIIISRDKHILRTYGVDDVYQVQALNHKHAVQLFCRNAFKSNFIMSDYKMLTYDVLSYCQGHPLAIEVLGSSLFGRDVLQWSSALARLRENKSKNILDVLRISFDQLEDTDKEIFLDIACFFNYDDEECVKKILDIRGFHPEYGLQVLVDKSLITVMDGEVYMHRLLEDLGKCIVREKSPKEPRKWSRLWDYKDLQKVMLDNMVSENLEAIVVDYREVPYNPKTPIKVDALSKMSHLKLLILEEMKYAGRLDNLSNELGHLYWKEYPFQCLPPSFQPDSLVWLSLPYSNIKQLWEVTKPLPNLVILDLSYSENLIEMPDIREALNLEVLNLQGCIQLRQIDPSIGLLRKLVFLNLEGCRNLVSLPNGILDLNSLKYLYLSNCSKLDNIHILDQPRDKDHLKNIGEAPIHYSQSASSYSRENKNSVSCLSPSSPIFPCMCLLDLSFCNLLKIPYAIKNLSCLEWLNLSGNNFATLPNLKELSRLWCLKLQHCKQLKYLPELPSQIDFPELLSQIDMPQERKRQYIGQHAGLYILNCPELIERERCTSLALSRIIQTVKVLHQFLMDYRRYLFIGSVTPGSEIPRWFNNQHVGTDSVMTIDASPVTHDNNWIGAVCCAVFVIRHETVKDPPQSAPLTDIFWGNLYAELVSEESDHRWLFFVRRRQFFRKSVHQGLEWALKIPPHLGCHVEVKKYGYRWVYKQDLGLSNLTMMHGRNLLPKKRKFSAIEQNEGRNQGKRSKGRNDISSAKWRKDDANSSLENTVKLLQNQFANLAL